MFTFIRLSNKRITNISEIVPQNLNSLTTFDNNFESLDRDRVMEFLLQLVKALLEFLNGVRGAA
jgi:hypothetical protein